MNVRAARFWYGVAAPFYDRLRNFLYPSAKTLTLQLIQNLPPHKSALCVGGGTGEWLNTYVQQHYSSTLFYVDASYNMLNKAKFRVQSNSINFIQADAKNITVPETVDLVILPFFLDHFSETEIESWLIFFQTLGNKNLQIAVADFKSNSAQSFLTKLLIWLASFLLNLKTNSLPQIQLVMSQKRFNIKWKGESRTCFAALYVSQ